MILRKTIKFLTIAALATAWVGYSHASAIIEWNFDGLPGGTAPVGMIGTSGIPGVSGRIYYGQGIARNNAWYGNFTSASKSSAWGATGWHKNALNAGSRSGAIANDVSYIIEFVIAPGVVLDLDTLLVPMFCERQNEDICNMTGQWQYQVNGGGWDPLGGEISIYESPKGLNQANKPFSWEIVDLSGIGVLGDVNATETTTVQIRLVMWGIPPDNPAIDVYWGKDGRTIPINQLPSFLDDRNSLIIYGTVIPEPSAAALLVFSSAVLLLRRRKRE